jgi:uncharacterized membrane protein YeiB
MFRSSDSLTECSVAGFQLGIMHFSFYVLNTILTSLAGTSVALVFSATTRQHTIGTVLTALVWVCMMVFSGTLVNVSTVPSFLQWLKWFSIFQYSMNVSDAAVEQTYAEIMKMYCVGSYLKMLPCMRDVVFFKVLLLFVPKSDLQQHVLYC